MAAKVFPTSVRGGGIRSEETDGLFLPHYTGYQQPKQFVILVVLRNERKGDHNGSYGELR